MDSYTDAGSLRCRCGRINADCPTGGHRCRACRQPDNPDITVFPWAAPGTRQEGEAYPFTVNPCPNTERPVCAGPQPGCLEQQYPAAMAYVPWQQWQSVYAPERGLVQGTIFPDMDLQFRHGRCSR